MGEPGVAGLHLTIRTVALCGLGAEIPVTVIGSSSSESRVIRVGESTSWPASGAIRVQIGGLGWVPNEQSFDVVATEGKEIVLDAIPESVITGRVVDAVTHAPIARFGRRLESVLQSSEAGRQTYIGSREDTASSDGSLCLVPIQLATSHRITIDADGYDARSTEWIPVSAGLPIELGDIELEPAAVRQIRVFARDGETGLPLKDVEVLAATYSFTDKDLVLAGTHIAPAPSQARGYSASQRVQTGADGVATVQSRIGEPLWLALWKEPYQLAVLEGAANTLAGSPAEVVVDLKRGPCIEGMLRIGAGLRAVVQNVRVEVRGVGAQHQVQIERDQSTESIPFVISGLNPGVAELWVVTDERREGMRPEPYVMAARTIVLVDAETQYVQLDCGIAGSEGTIQGTVSILGGMNLRSLRAFGSTDHASALPRSSVAVQDNHFVISDCNDTHAVVGVQGANDSGDVQLKWLAIVDGTAKPNLAVDVMRSVVHGHMGDISQLPMEAVVVTPINDHPFAGIRLAGVTAYPQADGEFAIYGLANGEYRAVGSYSGLRAEFSVSGGAVDVQLSR